MLLRVDGPAVSPVIGSVWVVMASGFWAMLLVVCVGFLLRMKASMSACWGGVYGFFSRPLLFDGNSSMLVFVDDISLAIGQVFGG
jgi:hypothetical protein